MKASSAMDRTSLACLSSLLLCARAFMQEAERAGFQQVLYPDSPGVDAWADTIASLDLPQWAAANRP